MATVEDAARIIEIQLKFHFIKYGLRRGRDKVKEDKVKNGI